MRSDLRRAATLLDERADFLYCIYRTHRFGQPWDTTQVRRKFYEYRRLAMTLRKMASEFPSERSRSCTSARRG